MPITLSFSEKVFSSIVVSRRSRMCFLNLFDYENLLKLQQSSPKAFFPAQKGPALNELTQGCPGIFFVFMETNYAAVVTLPFSLD